MLTEEHYKRMDAVSSLYACKITIGITLLVAQSHKHVNISPYLEMPTCTTTRKKCPIV